ncbi:MAG: TnpV protein [Clostridium sp.]|nr:TnpV protein [Clostridium sp.]
MAKSLFEEMGGKLNGYLDDIDRQAQERSHRLIEGMKQAQGNRVAKGRKRLRMDRKNE